MARKRKRSHSLLTFLLWLLLLSILMVSAARSEDRALLIGVGRYEQFDERLNGVDLDLAMMREFAHLLGFESRQVKVLEHEQASTEMVYAAVENWLIEGAGPQDRVLFYFSGHGSQVPDENMDEADQFDEVLLLYDTVLAQRHGRQTLSGVLIDDDFNRMLARMKSRNILVILDACHSGSATKRLRLSSRSFQAGQAKVKYFYYSPSLEAAGGSGSFDVMEPQSPALNGSRYVAITACRDDEKTVATAQGSIFTLGLRQTMRSAAVAGSSITPEELQVGTAKFIREQIRSDADTFHPQIAGNRLLRKRPLRLVFPGGGGNGFVRQKLESLVDKSNETVWVKLNKACFEPGEAMEISVWIPEPGFLNIMHIGSDDRATVLFPNKFQPQNAVKRGKVTLPGVGMEFEMVADGPSGSNMIAAFLTHSGINGYHSGFRNAKDVLAELSPNSTRSLILSQGEGWLASGRVTAEIRESGQCR